MPELLEREAVQEDYRKISRKRHQKPLEQSRRVSCCHLVPVAALFSGFCPGWKGVYMVYRVHVPLMVKTAAL